MDALINTILSILTSRPDPLFVVLDEVYNSLRIYINRLVLIELLCLDLITELYLLVYPH